MKCYLHKETIRKKRGLLINAAYKCVSLKYIVLQTTAQILPILAVVISGMLIICGKLFYIAAFVFAASLIISLTAFTLLKYEGWRLTNPELNPEGYTYQNKFLDNDDPHVKMHLQHYEATGRISMTSEERLAYMPACVRNAVNKNGTDSAVSKPAESSAAEESQQEPAYKRAESRIRCCLHKENETNYQCVSKKYIVLILSSFIFPISAITAAVSLMLYFQKSLTASQMQNAAVYCAGFIIFAEAVLICSLKLEKNRLRDPGENPQGFKYQAQDLTRYHSHIQMHLHHFNVTGCLSLTEKEFEFYKTVGLKDIRLQENWDNMSKILESKKTDSSR